MIPDEVAARVYAEKLSARVTVLLDGTRASIEDVLLMISGEFGGHAAAVISAGIEIGRKLEREANR